MKAFHCLAMGLASTALLAACSGPETNGAAEDAQEAYSEDSLATSEACFADTPSAHLNPGETLVERGPSGIVRISHALDGERADYEFAIVDLAEAQRQAIDNAAADFFRAAGDQYDAASDAVIYHRSRDGSFCAVVKDEATGRALAETAASVQAAIDAAE